jgi:DNA-binding CsgD family transcriptional regulator/catechol 2,3-dioxygenase-like lactoylglutathione lyase family enzyme
MRIALPAGVGREIPPAQAYDVRMPRTGRRGRPPHDDLLTPTEWRVLHAVQHGMTNKQIARRRGTSEDAVKFHVANVLAKVGARNRRELRKMSLIPATSALRRKGKVAASTEPTLRLGPLGQVARPVRNAAQSEQWYRDVLGLPHLYTFGTMAFFDMAGTRLMLSQAESLPAGESPLYFLTTDIDAAHALLQARGVQFLNAPHLIHRHADGVEEWMCFFQDPDGRALALMQNVAPVPTDE